MKMKLTQLLAVVILASNFLSPANAGLYMTSSRLLSLCESELVSEQNVCVGYVLGIADAAQVLDEEESMRRFCLPNDVTSSQLESTAVKYLNDNQDQMDRSASFNLLVALRKAFPCS